MTSDVCLDDGIITLSFESAGADTPIGRLRVTKLFNGLCQESNQNCLVIVRDAHFSATGRFGYRQNIAYSKSISNFVDDHIAPSLGDESDLKTIIVLQNTRLISVNSRTPFALDPVLFAKGRWDGIREVRQPSFASSSDSGTNAPHMRRYRCPWPRHFGLMGVERTRECELHRIIIRRRF